MDRFMAVVLASQMLTYLQTCLDYIVRYRFSYVNHTSIKCFKFYQDGMETTLSKLANSVNGISQWLDIAEGNITESVIKVIDSFQNKTQRNKIGGEEGDAASINELQDGFISPTCVQGVGREGEAQD